MDPRPGEYRCLWDPVPVPPLTPGATTGHVSTCFETTIPAFPWALAEVYHH